MATATKTARTLVASQSLSAGGSLTQTPATDLRTAAGDFLVTAVVANGATGPTVPCDVIVEVSNDNVTWREFVRLAAGATSGETYAFSALVPAPALYVRVKFTGHTGQAVTVAAEGHEYTSIS